jgi:glycosyltransferase involved in cell wall biosynthesis
MKISICILTWNRPKFLEICVDDLKGKMFYNDDFEIIIMDDGSTGETQKLLEKLGQNRYIRIISNRKHKGLKAYKRLFGKAKGDYIIEVDDDVLEFPLHFDKTMIEYMNCYPDYGFLALDVIQNEFTNGAKPDSSHYTEDIRGDKVIQKGTTGGWCTCFRRIDYRKIKFWFNLKKLGFKYSEDAALANLFYKHLRLHSGIIKDHVCFHACGPHYAKQYGHLEREIEKYQSSGLTSFVEHYKSFLSK